MKKLMSILLVLLMLTSVLASCGGNDETTTTEVPTTEAPTTEAPTTEAPTTEIPTTEAPTTEAPTTEAPTTEAPTTEAPTTNDPDVIWSSKNDVRDTWNGKTLNVACSTWYATGAPWAMPEVFITEKNDANFGAQIQQAVLDRNEFIENTYGVKVNWINATKAGMPKALEEATLAGNIYYDLAAPRMMNVQAIVAGGYVYDLADREFIDFRNSYYNDNSVEAYTAYGHTFFVTGSFSHLEKHTASVLYVSKNLMGEVSENGIEDLYKLVKEGKWTYDKLVGYCEAIYSDNGNAEDEFRYVHGLSSYSSDRFFNYFDVTRGGVNKATGEWELITNDENVDGIIDAIINTKTANWYKDYSWHGWGSTNADGFKKDKILFFTEVLEFSYELEDKGIVPFPMLNEEQSKYRVPCSMQMSVAMCIPKITQDRNMSDYFMDVLFWTGEEYVMKEYIKDLKTGFSSDKDIEMLTDYIIPNISYDPGEAVGWGQLFPLSSTYYSNGYKNNFDQVYDNYSPTALDTIAEWNKAWGSYTEE
ncbi:MAG: hypothetical protein IJF26_06305 [Clostridia bacterium]|nr:hypothetical protein [Clostridia bacterium]